MVFYPLGVFVCIAACDLTGTDPSATAQCPVCGFGSVPDSFTVPRSVTEARALASLFLAGANAIERLVQESESEEDLKVKLHAAVENYCARAQQFLS